MSTQTTPAEEADKPADAEQPEEQTVEPSAEEKRSEADAEAFAGDVKGALTDNDELFEKVEDSDENDEPSDNTGTESSEDDSTVGTTDESDEQEESEEESEEQPTQPAADIEEDNEELTPEITPDDPGEFQPGDYSFEVITTDGKTHKIKNPDDADALTDLLDEKPDLINAKNLMEFIRKTSRMEAGIEADKKAHQAKVEQYESVKEQEEVKNKTLISINNGMLYLQQKGMLDAVPSEYDNASTKWEDHTNIPAIKQRLDILKYMENENKARMDVGLEPSFDVIAAHNAMQLEEMKNQKKTDQDTESKKRQAKGAKVGSTAAYSQTNVTKGEIVGEGGSLNELYDWE